jgi:hypothetical protein
MIPFKFDGLNKAAIFNLLIVMSTIKSLIANSYFINNNNNQKIFSSKSPLISNLDQTSSFQTTYASNQNENTLNEYQESTFNFRDGVDKPLFMLENFFYNLRPEEFFVKIIDKSNRNFVKKAFMDPILKSKRQRNDFEKISPEYDIGQIISNRQEAVKKLDQKLTDTQKKKITEALSKDLISKLKNVYVVTSRSR